jgi:Multiubiquitin
LTVTDTTIETHEDERHRSHFTIKVNDQKVTLTEHHLTGAEIKAAAIAAGAPIQPDFVLSRVLPHGKQKIVPDDKKVHVDQGDEFWAIPGDDNS